MLTRQILTLLIFVMLSCACFAKKPAPVVEPVHQPLISRPVQLLAEDNFNRSALGPNWKVLQGEVVLSDGELNAHLDGELVEDGPIQRGLARADFARPTQNVGVVCRVKTDSAMATVLGLTRAGRGSGYAVSVALHQSGKVTVHADGGILVTVRDAAKPGTWNDVMFEVVGPRVVVQINGKKVADAETPAIPREQKKGFAFGSLKGESRLDNLAVGEIAAKP